MDRISRAEVGGPYASHDDAMRAIQNKGFDSDPADLTVQEGSSDDDDDSSKQASLKQAKFPPPADSGAGATMKPAPEDPLKVKDAKPEETPEDAGKSDEAAPPFGDDAAPDDTADPTAPDNGSSLPEAPGEAEDPFAMSGPQVTTTKPAQIPSGGGGGMPGVPGMPEGDGDMPGDEEDVSVDPPQEGETPDTAQDPVSSAIDKVTAQVRRDNPDLPGVLARRVARKVVGKMIQANGLMPDIEDPLANKSPLSVVRDIVKTVPKGSPAAAPSHEDDADGDDGDDDSSLPFHRGPAGRMSPGAAPAAEGAGAAAEGAGLLEGAAELAPLLLV